MLYATKAVAFTGLLSAHVSAFAPHMDHKCACNSHTGVAQEGKMYAGGCVQEADGSAFCDVTGDHSATSKWGYCGPRPADGSDIEEYGAGYQGDNLCVGAPAAKLMDCACNTHTGVEQEGKMYAGGCVQEADGSAFCDVTGDHSAASKWGYCGPRPADGSDIEEYGAGYQGENLCVGAPAATLMDCACNTHTGVSQEDKMYAGGCVQSADGSAFCDVTDDHSATSKWAYCGPRPADGSDIEEYGAGYQGENMCVGGPAAKLMDCACNSHTGDSEGDKMYAGGCVHEEDGSAWCDTTDDHSVTSKWAYCGAKPAENDDIDEYGAGYQGENMCVGGPAAKHVGPHADVA